MAREAEARRCGSFVFPTVSRSPRSLLRAGVLVCDCGGNGLLFSIVGLILKLRLWNV